MFATRIKCLYIITSPVEIWNSNLFYAITECARVCVCVLVFFFLLSTTFTIYALIWIDSIFEIASNCFDWYFYVYVYFYLFYLAVCSRPTKFEDEIRLESFWSARSKQTIYVLHISNTVRCKQRYVSLPKITVDEVNW